MEITEDNIDIFKNDADCFIKINDMIKDTRNLIKPLQHKLKILINEKKDLEKQLCQTMSYEKNNLKRAEFSESSRVLEYKIKEVLVPVKVDTIKDKLERFFVSGEGSELRFNSLTGQEKGKKIYDYIYAKENRETVTKETIKNMALKQ